MAYKGIIFETYRRFQDSNFKPVLLRIKANHNLTKLIVVFVVFFTGLATALGQIPVAGFTANKTSGCAPLTVTFTDQSTGNPTSWNWQFGNGQLSTAKNPVVTFSQP